MSRRIFNSGITGSDVFANITITGAAPATPVAQRVYQDSIVKGWLETSGAGTPVIDDDLNVTSITDNGVGDWTINWATAFANANYAVVLTIHATALADVIIPKVTTTTAKSTTVVRITMTSGGGVATDPTEGLSLIAIGDQ